MSIMSRVSVPKFAEKLLRSPPPPQKKLQSKSGRHLTAFRNEL